MGSIDGGTIVAVCRWVDTSQGKDDIAIVSEDVLFRMKNSFCGTNADQARLNAVTSAIFMGQKST